MNIYFIFYISLDQRVQSVYKSICPTYAIEIYGKIKMGSKHRFIGCGDDARGET